jgi:hypothetical protein
MNPRRARRADARGVDADADDEDEVDDDARATRPVVDATATARIGSVRHTVPR